MSRYAFGLLLITFAASAAASACGTDSSKSAQTAFAPGSTVSGVPTSPSKPPAPTPTRPTPTVAPAGLQPGMTATLTSTIRLRVTPSMTSVTFGSVPAGTKVTIRRGPQLSEGLEWCQFEAPGEPAAWTECASLRP